MPIKSYIPPPKIDPWINQKYVFHIPHIAWHYILSPIFLSIPLLFQPLIVIYYIAYSLNVAIVWCTTTANSSVDIVIFAPSFCVVTLSLHPEKPPYFSPYKWDISENFQLGCAQADAHLQQHSGSSSSSTRTTYIVFVHTRGTNCHLFGGCLHQRPARTCWQARYELLAFT